MFQNTLGHSKMTFSTIPSHFLKTFRNPRLSSISLICLHDSEYILQYTCISVFWGQHSLKREICGRNTQSSFHQIISEIWMYLLQCHEPFRLHIYCLNDTKYFTCFIYRYVIQTSIFQIHVNVLIMSHMKPT